MASQDGTSFEAMIHADRNRKKNEDLAAQIFGRSKSAQNVNNKRQKPQEPRSPSLASRMGVQKRSSSTSVPTQNKNPFNPPSRPSSTTPVHRNQHNNNNAARANRIASEITNGNANINVSTSRNSSFRNDRNGEIQPQTQSQSQTQPQLGAGPGLTIKGSAGPFTLQASNFDPGTTEADIEAALYSELFDDKGNNTLTSCRIVSTRPAVVAEMVLTEKSVADKIIRKFHNLKADGRILKVVLIKSGSDSLPRRKDLSRGGSAVAQTIEPPEVIEDTTGGVGAGAEGDMDMDDAEITTDYPATSSYDHEREAADRDRRDRDRNRDRDEYAASGGRRDDRRDPDRPREDRDRDRRRDDRDRDEERDRERERERDREPRDTHREPQGPRDRDREYDRRDTYETRPSQPRPPPAYGNGFNRPPRGAYGYGNRGGYGFPRGGNGYGGRGGYRGY